MCASMKPGESVASPKSMTCAPAGVAAPDQQRRFARPTPPPGLACASHGHQTCVSWKLRYKRRSEAPKKLRRRLFRISALLDAADDELSYVYEQVSNIKAYYADAIARGDLPLEMDRDSVDALLTKRAAVGGSIAQLVSKLKPLPNLIQTEEQVRNGAECSCLR